MALDIFKLINDKVLGATNAPTNLGEKLPVKNFEKNITVMRSGRVVHAYEIECPLMERWTHEDYDVNAGIFQSSFKSLPEGAVVQKLDVFYYDYQAKGKGLGFFESRYMDHFFGRPKLKHKSYLFIISPNATNKKRQEDDNLFAKPNIKENKQDNENLSARIDEWALIAPQYIQEISTIDNIKFNRLEDEDMKLLYRQFFNLEFRFDPGDAARAIENKNNCLVIGEKKVNVLSLTEQSREVENSRKNYYGVDSSHTYNLNGYFLKPHIINTNYWIENTEKKLDQLDSKKIEANVAGEMNSEAGDVMSEGLSELTNDMRKNQMNLVSMSKTMIIWGMDDGYRERVITEAISEARSINDANMIVESLCTAVQFFACLPGNGAENVRYLLMPSDVGVAYQDWTTCEWPLGHGDYFADRFRNPVLVPIYNKDIDSQNGLLVGPTGSGKSFFWNHLVIQRHERKERQILIDVGGTYKNNVEAIGGKYYKYDIENPISFNPFLVTPTLREDKKKEYKLSGEKKQFIINILGEIWLSAYPDKEKKSVLEAWIEKYYEFEGEVLRKEKPPLENFIETVSINNFYYWVSDWDVTQKGTKEWEKFTDLVKMNSFLMCLRSFVIGDKKALLNNPSNVDISDNCLICFDMAGVKDDKDLYKLVTMLLVELTIDVLRKYPDDIKHFVMDEAWSMISEGSMSEFVGYMYRTIRKLKGSVFIITQGVKEIVDSAIGDVIIGQSATKIILYHSDPAKVELLGKHLGFSEQDLDKIRSLRRQVDAREFFIKQETLSDVFTIEVPLEEHVLITSNPTERNHFNKLKEKYNGDTQRAVEEWVIDKKTKRI